MKYFLTTAIDYANGDATEAQTVTNAGIERITTKALAEETISGAWEQFKPGTGTPAPAAPAS